MNLISRVGIGILLLILVACSNGIKEQAIASPLGLLKVTITGIGEGAVVDAKAEWVQTGVSGQASTLVPANGSSAVNDIQFSKRYVGFLDDDSTSKRYIATTFDLTNRTTINFQNLSLYAVNVPTNLGGTGIANLTAGTGSAITDSAVARGFKPIHGMRGLIQGLEVNPNWADLQLFTPAEASNLQSQGLSTPDPFNPGHNILPTGSTVLEYGFVARGQSGGRNIKSRNINTVGAEDCTAETCKGTITLAYQLPKVSPRSANPFSFSLYFLVANETVQMGSQSLEEQTPNTVMGLTTPSASFIQLRTLAGSSFWESRTNYLCRVKIATTPDLYLGPTPLTGGGSLDTCFGVDGKVITDFGSSHSGATALAIQPDGKIVAAGFSSNGSSLSSEDFALTRYNPNGTLDTTFGTGGKVTTDYNSSEDVANALAIQSDGKIVVVGYTNNGTGYDFAVFRYNPNGTLDTTFNVTGKLTTDFGLSNDLAYAVVIQGDGKIVVVGGRGYPSSDFAVARYNPDGSLDATFDTDGKVITPAFGSATSVALQTNGKIVVGGAGNDGGSGFRLARYNTNGSLDTTFDIDGKVSTDFDYRTEGSFSVAIQSDGKIVLAGYGHDNNSAYANFALARYNPDGSLDSSFDTDGKVTTDFSGAGDVALSATIQPDGKIVVAGYSYVSSDSREHFALARYNPNGSLDTTFDTDGKVTTAIGLTSDHGYALAIQPDGKIVVAGNSDNFIALSFALTRYNP